MKRYIFVFGTARSGTSLLRNLLNRHPDIALTNESHFWGGPFAVRLALDTYRQAPPITVESPRLGWHPALYSTKRSMSRRWAEIGDPHTDAGMAKIVDDIYVSDRTFLNVIMRYVKKEEFLDRLLRTNRSPRDIFKTIVDSVAADKPIGGEKTPGHIHFAPTLMKWFPGSTIINCVRDLRAVYVSEQRKKTRAPAERLTRRHLMIRRSPGLHRPYVASKVAVGWRRDMQLDVILEQMYPGNYIRWKYEDFIANPEGAVRALCARLNVSFDEQMLNVEFSNSSFSRPTTGLDAGARDRWRELIDSPSLSLLTGAGRYHLERLGYRK